MKIIHILYLVCGLKLHKIVLNSWKIKPRIWSIIHSIVDNISPYIADHTNSNSIEDTWWKWNKFSTKIEEKREEMTHEDGGWEDGKMLTRGQLIMNGEKIEEMPLTWEKEMKRHTHPVRDGSGGNVCQTLSAWHWGRGCQVLSN